MTEMIIDFSRVFDGWCLQLRSEHRMFTADQPISELVYSPIHNRVYAVGGRAGNVAVLKGARDSTAPKILEIFD